MASSAEVKADAAALGTEGVDWERIRFTASVALFGAAVGATTILVNFLTRAIPPQVPQHLPPTQSLYFGGIGALVGLIVAVPGAWIIYGRMPTFHSDRARGPRRFRAWLGLGAGYSALHVLLVGSLFLPMGNLWLRFVHSQVDISQLLSTIPNNLMLAPYFAMSKGLELLFTGTVAAVVFAVGGALIDRINASADPKTAAYGALVSSLALSAAVIAFVMLAPPETVASLGDLAP